MREATVQHVPPLLVRVVYDSEAAASKIRSKVLPCTVWPCPNFEHTRPGPDIHSSFMHMMTRHASVFA